MSRGSLTGTRVLVVASTLLLGACGSGPAATSGTGGTSSAGTGGGTSAGGTGGTSAGGTGGTSAGGTGGTSAGGTGGTSASGSGGGGTASCGAVGPATGAPGFGTPAQAGMGTSSAKYFGADVTRDGASYRFITNWWGMGWGTADVSYNGTSFTMAAATGTSMPDGTPIGYPATYCGRYSESGAARGNCGLPAAYSTIGALWTGWKWSSADPGQYNAAWDIWLGTASLFQSYLMVWLRDPPARQPAGNGTIDSVTVTGVPGTWRIVYGTVNNRPIVNYVRVEGQDACEFEFDVMAFINDAQARAATTSGLTLPGDTVRAVAAGFEFWTGPFTNVTSEDFYVRLTTK